jgi:hypothetical protein
MSSIIEQANARIDTGESRFQSRGNLDQLESQQSEANFAAQAAKNKQKAHQAVSQYMQSNAGAEEIQGKQLIASGNAKKAVGGGLMGMGFGMVAIGLALSIFGGSGAALVSSGMTMVGQGVGQLVMGGVDVANGKGALLRAQEKLDKATDNNIMSKEEGKVVRKEMNRSKILEFKKNALKDLVDTMRPQLEQMGVNPNELDEKALSKWFDKMFEQGADTLANGGVMETDLKDVNGEALFTDENGEALEGTFYFIRDEESGEFFQVEPATDEEGNIITGALGEPLLDTEQGVNKVVDGDLKRYLDLSFQFVDLAAQAARQLGTTEYNDLGESTYTGYDTNNLEHMKEFADLVGKTNIEAIESGQLEGPLKVIEEEGEIFLQKWDWVNDIPIGLKIPFDEITGGTYDKGNIESYQAAMDRSAAAFEELGIGAGSQTFNLLAAQDNFNFRSTGSLGESSVGFGDLSGRDSDAFRNFSNVRNTLSLAREPSILESSTSDKTKDGKA